jgi:hypothetical protein
MQPQTISVVYQEAKEKLMYSTYDPTIHIWYLTKNNNNDEAEAKVDATTVTSYYYFYYHYYHFQIQRKRISTFYQSKWSAKLLLDGYEKTTIRVWKFGNLFQKNQIKTVSTESF